MSSTPQRSAFSLIELVVVLVAFAVLAALAVPTFSRLVADARDRSTLLTAQAVVGETVAMAFGGSPSSVDLATSVGELPADDEWQLRTGAGEYSDAHRVIHGGVTSDLVGAAARTPTGRCAYARASVTSAVRDAWLSSGDVGAQCSFALALAGPGEPPPPTTTTTTPPPPPACDPEGTSAVVPASDTTTPTWAGGLSNTVALPAAMGADGPVGTTTTTRAMPSGGAATVGAAVNNRTAGILNAVPLAAASASSLQSSTLYPANALNRDNTTGGATDATRFHTATATSVESWLQVDLGAGRSATVSSFAVRTTANNAFPRRTSGLTTKVQGSNDASSWTDLYSGSPSQVTQGGNWGTWSFTESAAYRYFRLTATPTDSTNNNYLILDEFELFGTLTQPSYSVHTGTALAAPSPTAATTGAAVLAKTAGILNAIGSTGGSWRNPLEVLPPTSRSNAAFSNASATVLTNRSGVGATGNNRFHTAQGTNPFVTIDLGPHHRAQVSSYALGTADNALGYTSATQTAWRLEGSTDNSTWSLIDARSGSASQAAGTWGLYDANGSGSSVAGAYRYLRLTSIGASTYLILDEVEFFGQLYAANAYAVAAPASGAITDATPSDPATSVMDKSAGVLNRLATANNGTWTNPVGAVVSTSGTAENASWPYSNLANRSAESGGAQTSSATGANIVFDLGADRRVQVGAYSLKTSSGNTNPVDMTSNVDNQARQGWKLEASNDNTAWALLDAHTAQQAANTWRVWVPNGEAADVATSWRYLRFSATSPGAAVLQIDEIEFHGIGWQRPPSAPTDAKLWVVGRGWAATFTGVPGATSTYIQVADAAGNLVFDAAAATGITGLPNPTPSSLKLRVASVGPTGQGAFSAWTDLVATCPGTGPPTWPTPPTPPLPPKGPDDVPDDDRVPFAVTPSPVWTRSVICTPTGAYGTQISVSGTNTSSLTLDGFIIGATYSCIQRTTGPGGASADSPPTVLGAGWSGGAGCSLTLSANSSGPTATRTVRFVLKPGMYVTTRTSSYVETRSTTLFGFLWPLFVDYNFNAGIYNIDQPPSSSLGGAWLGYDQWHVLDGGEATRSRGPFTQSYSGSGYTGPERLSYYHIEAAAGASNGTAAGIVYTHTVQFNFC